MKVEFFVPGQPVGKARPRITLMGHAFTPKKTVEAENRIRSAYLISAGDSAPTSEPVLVRIAARYAIPTSGPRKKKDEARLEEESRFQWKRNRADEH